MAMRLGVVGVGVVGQAILKAANDGTIPFTVPVVHDVAPEKAESFLCTLDHPPRMTDLASVVDGSDLIFEAASRPAVEQVCRAAFPKGKNVAVISVGALLDRPDLVDLAKQYGARIFIPSGGMIGLDGLKGASVGRIDSVTITTRKSPRSLRNIPYVRECGVDIDAIDKAVVIFEGNPIEACAHFPQNINVAASVSLAGVGPLRTTLRIFADPGVERNIHEVETVGEFGRSLIRIENVPHEGHGPGMLTYLSCIAFLKSYGETLVIGT